MTVNEMLVSLAQCDTCSRFYDRNKQHEDCPHRQVSMPNEGPRFRKWCDEHEALDMCWEAA